jgi:hypothetical protein
MLQWDDMRDSTPEDGPAGRGTSTKDAEGPHLETTSSLSLTDAIPRGVIVLAGRIISEIIRVKGRPI